MKSESGIFHEATVKSVSGSSVTVSLVPGISCAGCMAAKSCGMSEKNEKIMTIDGSFTVIPGDRVSVSIKESQGFLAIVLAYVFPLILVVATLVATTASGVDELISGLLSFGLLIPYYLIIYLLRKVIGRKFTFNINRVI